MKRKCPICRHKRSESYFISGLLEYVVGSPCIDCCVKNKLPIYNHPKKSKHLGSKSNRKKKSRRKHLASKYSWARLGFNSYAAYLSSSLWRSIRNMVVSRDHFCCVACGLPAENVHHNNYRMETMRGEDLSGLVTLCRPCHEATEGLSNESGIDRVMDESVARSE